ncbi:MAG: DUF192 domain-containing protein [Candidatus Aquicultorales bacterium]
MEIATGFFRRMVGLIGRRSIDQGCGLLILPSRSVHTYFMRFSIDVVFVGKDSEVVATIISLKPWRITRFRKNARAVLELPVGKISSAEISIGDRLTFTKR